MKIRVFHGFIHLLVLTLFFSCDRDMVYDQFQHIDSDGWSWDQPVTFDVELTDTTSEFDILLQLRHTTDYPLSNLYTYVGIAGPSGQTMQDTVQFLLARPDGEWIGKGTGKTRGIRYLYKTRTRFPEPGTYRFSVEQAMRIETLPVTDVGLRIEHYHP